MTYSKIILALITLLFAASCSKKETIDPDKPTNGESKLIYTYQGAKVESYLASGQFVIGAPIIFHITTYADYPDGVFRIRASDITGKKFLELPIFNMTSLIPGTYTTTSADRRFNTIFNPILQFSSVGADMLPYGYTFMLDKPEDNILIEIQNVHDGQADGTFKIQASNFVPDKPALQISDGKFWNLKVQKF